MLLNIVIQCTRIEYNLTDVERKALRQLDAEHIREHVAVQVCQRGPHLTLRARAIVERLLNEHGIDGRGWLVRL